MEQPKFNLSICYPGAEHTDNALEVTGMTIEEWDKLTDEEKSAHAWDWAQNYIEVTFYVGED